MAVFLFKKKLTKRSAASLLKQRKEMSQSCAWWGCLLGLHSALVQYNHCASWLHRQHCFFFFANDRQHLHYCSLDFDWLLAAAPCFCRQCVLTSFGSLGQTGISQVADLQ
jgi:hypothetical protein